MHHLWRSKHATNVNCTTLWFEARDFRFGWMVSRKGGGRWGMLYEDSHDLNKTMQPAAIIPEKKRVSSTVG
ncbi:unnamed protein product, partial [Ilex paraguariensis]